MTRCALLETEIMVRDESNQVEATNISRHGFWMLLDGREMFLPFETFPWFAEAPVGGILNVQRPHPHHLYWPDLDVDLTVPSIENPGQYPLVFGGDD